jgi:hypothetical protein
VLLLLLLFSLLNICWFCLFSIVTIALTWKYVGSVLSLRSAYGTCQHYCVNFYLSCMCNFFVVNIFASSNLHIFLCISGVCNASRLGPFLLL